MKIKRLIALLLIVMMIVNWNPHSRAWIASHSLFRKKKTAEASGKEAAQ